MSGWELTGVVLLIVFALIVIWAVFTLARAKRAPARTTVDRPSERPGRSDDLTRLEGIGPKSSEALNAAGISTFQQLVDGTEARFFADPRRRRHVLYGKHSDMVKAGRVPHRRRRSGLCHLYRVPRQRRRSGCEEVTEEFGWSSGTVSSMANHTVDITYCVP